MKYYLTKECKGHLIFFYIYLINLKIYINSSFYDKNFYISNALLENSGNYLTF